MVRAPPYEVWTVHGFPLLHFLVTLSRMPVPADAYASSWFRDAETNRRVGGHPQSLHLWGGAVDVVVRSYEERTQLVSDAQALGLSALNEGTHVHIQAYPPGRRGVWDPLTRRDPVPTARF